MHTGPGARFETPDEGLRPGGQPQRADSRIRCAIPSSATLPSSPSRRRQGLHPAWQASKEETR